MIALRLVDSFMLHLPGLGLLVGPSPAPYLAGASHPQHSISACPSKPNFLFISDRINPPCYRPGYPLIPPWVTGQVQCWRGLPGCCYHVTVLPRKWGDLVDLFSSILTSAPGQHNHPPCYRPGYPPGGSWVTDQTPHWHGLPGRCYRVTVLPMERATDKGQRCEIPPHHSRNAGHDCRRISNLSESKRI